MSNRLMAKGRGSGRRKPVAMMSLLILLVSGVLCVAAAPEGWKVPEAPVRFHVRLTSPPTHPEAGYFMALPDGGILPGPVPRTIVFDANGKELQSFALWHNRLTSLAMVCEAPESGDSIVVYAVGSQNLAKWTPRSGLKPSAIQCIQSNRGSREVAHALAGLGSVDPQVDSFNRPGLGSKAPLCISGNITGRAGPCGIYMLAHVNTVDPGRTFVAPIVFNGGAEVKIDGAPLKIEKISDKPCGNGAYVNLEKGLHRLEIFAWSDDGQAPVNGLMTLTWRTPKTTDEQLGGKRPTDLKYPGTPMWEARKFDKNEIVLSGGASLVKAEARDGRPVAPFKVTTLNNFWFEGEPRVNICHFEPLVAGNPEGTRYTWEFENGGRPMRRDPMWLFEGGRDRVVSLTATLGDKSTSCRRLFFPHTTAKTDLNNPEPMERYRQAALDVLEAYPGDVDPTAAWGKGCWNNLFRCMELNKGRDLLTHLINVRWDVVRAKVSPEQEMTLREIALDFAPRIDPMLALMWTQKFQDAEKSDVGRAMMDVAAAEVFMYYLREPDKARSLLEQVIRKNRGNEAAEWGWIRMGDLAWLEGDLNKATQIYGQVQERAKNLDIEMPAYATQRKKETTRPSRSTPASAAAANVADWKVNALLDVCSSETCQELVRGGYMLEAKRLLRQWERKFPMSKINSDYLITESDFYMKLKDYGRAHAILEPYCSLLEASSFLPDAAEKLLECKEALKRPKQEIYEFAKEMHRKLEFHPVAYKFKLTMRHYAR